MDPLAQAPADPWDDLFGAPAYAPPPSAPGLLEDLTCIFIEQVRQAEELDNSVDPRIARSRQETHTAMLVLAMTSPPL